jgi:Holliday junction resolvase-like predicted endonuclease
MQNKSNKKLPHNLEIGAAGERIAANYYSQKGYRIIARNFYNTRGKRVGEIDFVAIKGMTIRFVEVKSRVAIGPEFALHDVNYPKCLRLLLAIKYFLLLYPSYLRCMQHIDLAVVLFSEFDKSRASVRIYPDVIDDSLK